MLTHFDFVRAAGQRFIAAEFLLENGYHLDSLYLAGYVVECSIKSVIIFLTNNADRQSQFDRISHGATMHRWETLLHVLRDVGGFLPEDVVRGLRRFGWDPSLRYETVRPPKGEVRGYLKRAQLVIEWARSELP